MVMERTSDGRPLRILAVIDEYTRECLALHVARRIRSGDVLDELYELFLRRGMPQYIRSDNGPEFAAKAVRNWLNRLDVTTLFIEPGSPWENGYIESFNGKMRDELLNGELLDTLDEAKVLVEAWRRVYNRIRPHSSLGYRPPAPEAHVGTSSLKTMPPKMRVLWQNSREEDVPDEEVEVHGGTDRLCLAAGGGGDSHIRQLSRPTGWIAIDRGQTICLKTPLDKRKIGEGRLRCFLRAGCGSR
jgi:hypothetical protein